jgi:pyruvate kinase
MSGYLIGGKQLEDQDMRRLHRTKIVATLGPATSSAKMVGALFDAGVDVFRLNFSHGEHEDHRKNVGHIRALEAKIGRPAAILMDLQGPKLRVGAFTGDQIMLETGAAFRFILAPCEGDVHQVTLPHKEIYSGIESGTELLLDDGRLRVRVTDCGADFADCEVVTGGVLSNRKGVNVPGVLLPISPLTSKDRADLQFGLDLGVDLIGLSFVQRPEDIAEARRLIAGRAGVLAKLEKPAAIDHLDEIIELSDAVMVARGDLGVEMPPEDVPVLQKRIILACRQVGKPVVVATQMLESMIDSPTPTRAEASDVATAVYDGADAVMLSAETAVGKYPVDAAGMMNRIIERVERAPNYRRVLSAEELVPEATAADAISAAARQVAHTLSAAAIVTFTTSGSTTLRAARERPEVPIIGLTPNLETARRLAIVWGVHSIHSSDARNFQEMVDKASHFAVDDDFAKFGDRIIITAGVPFGTPGATNVLRIARVTA